MRINLPNSAFLGNIDSFLRSYDPKRPEVLKITAHPQWISIHPVVLCMVTALGMKAKDIRCERLEAKSRHYLERMGMFRLLGMDSGMNITEHESAGRFIPLTQISDSDHLTGFITEMIPMLHLKPEKVESIRYIVSELVRNVLEHSRSKIGAIVCAQYYPKSRTIRIGIVDSGVGVRETINKTHDAKDDMEALRLAMIPGITGTTAREGGTEFNAGAGLFFIRSIASVNRDFFMIYSGNAMYKLLKSRSKKIKLHADPFEDRHSKDDDYPVWNGTVVGIDISLDTSGAFSLLLDLIRDIYIKSIRERKRKKARRPRFI